MRMQFFTLSLCFLLGSTSATRDLDLNDRFGGRLHVRCLPYGIQHVSILPHGREEYVVEDVIEPHVTPIPCGGSGYDYSNDDARAPASSSIHLNGVEASPSDAIDVSFKVNGNQKVAASIRPWGNGEGAHTSLEATFTFDDTAAGGVYGLPERATHFKLPNRKYRLWNLDVFKYELHVSESVYGSIPHLTAVASDGTAVGLLWLNAADTHVDVSGGAESGTDYKTTWESVHGVYDFYLMPGPTPSDVLKQLAFLTGRAAMPPLFAIGFHQCRWNYRDERDVAGVNEGFESHDMPADVLWLDIEHTDGKRYFTYDKHMFPSPQRMINGLAAHGRKLVVISDPHIKRADGYKVFEEARDGKHFVRDSSGENDFEGKCWPGQSSWVDYVNPASRAWYGDQFGYDKYTDSAPEVYFWIDMNEPSVFEGPETTMPGDSVHVTRSGRHVRHSEVHNMYGYYMNMAAYDGVIKRSTTAPHRIPTRPFLLSRSFFAGTQKYCAVWTGDNKAEWSHLEVSIPMLLGMSTAGLPFVGADVGGFFNFPDAELMTRWMQLGAVYPFFRAHAHLESKRREPWLYGEPHTSHIRTALRLRYQVLPHLYGAFFASHAEGDSVWQPLVADWPSDPTAAACENAALIGHALMVVPVVKQGATSVDVYFPSDDGRVKVVDKGAGALEAWWGRPAGRWFDFYNGHEFAGTGRSATVNAPIDKLPLFMRGGSIVATRSRPRRSSAAQFNDPFTLTVAPSAAANDAAGFLYLDDSHSFLFEEGVYALRLLTYNAGVLRSAAVTPTDLFGRYANVTAPLPISQWGSVVASKMGDSVRGAQWAEPLPSDARIAAAAAPIASAQDAGAALAGAVLGLKVEKVILFGATKAPTSVTVEVGADKREVAGVHFDAKKGVVTLPRVNLPAGGEWEVHLHW